MRNIGEGATPKYQKAGFGNESSTRGEIAGDSSKADTEEQRRRERAEKDAEELKEKQELALEKKLAPGTIENLKEEIEVLQGQKKHLQETIAKMESKAVSRRSLSESGKTGEYGKLTARQLRDMLHSEELNLIGLKGVRKFTDKVRAAFGTLPEDENTSQAKIGELKEAIEAAESAESGRRVSGYDASADISEKARWIGREKVIDQEIEVAQKHIKRLEGLLGE